MCVYVKIIKEKLFQQKAWTLSYHHSTQTENVSCYFPNTEVNKYPIMSAYSIDHLRKKLRMSGNKDLFLLPKFCKA